MVIHGNIIYGTVGSNDGPLNGWNTNAMACITRGSRTKCRDVIIRHNILYDNSNGIRLHPGFKIYNNTLIANNRDHSGSNPKEPVQPLQFWGVYNQANSDGAAIKNNIFANHQTAANRLKLDVLGKVDIDYNLYHNEKFVKYVNIRENQSLDTKKWRQHLQNDRLIRGEDRNSIEADPAFVNVPQKASRRSHSI